MRNLYEKLLSVTIMVVVVLLAPFATVFGKDVPRITKEALRPIMSDADVVIIDVRKGRDWSSSEFKIQGAVRENPKQITEWEGNYAKDRKLVLYCA